MLKLGEAKKQPTEKELAAMAKEGLDAKKVPIFQALELMHTKKVPWAERDESFKKVFSRFMFIRFIGLFQERIDALSLFCELPNIPDCAWHDAVCTILPNKYPWPPKGLYAKIYKDDKDEEEEIRCVTEYFSCGTRDAKEICNKLSDAEIENIVKAYQKPK